MNIHYTKNEINNLIKEISKGDEESLKKLYKKFSKAVYFLSLSILHNHEKAQDIVQDTFIIIVKKANTFHSLKNGDAWIFKIARNLSISILRKEKKNKEIPLENIGENNLKLSSNENIISTLDSKLFIKSLTDEELTILTLKDQYGYTQDKIAFFMGVSKITIKRRIAKIKEKYNIFFNEK